MKNAEELTELGVRVGTLSFLIKISSLPGNALIFTYFVVKLSIT